jgi:iron-sulfur cluster assembly accessory protein
MHERRQGFTYSRQTMLCPHDADGIIFADILLPLEGMGIRLEFAQGEGPVIHNPVRTREDVDRLRVPQPQEDLGRILGVSSRTIRRDLDELMEQKGVRDTHALRVFIRAGGCSGFQYGMTFDSSPRPVDSVFEEHGLRVVVDPQSLQYMAGSSIDYVDDPAGVASTSRS